MTLRTENISVRYRRKVVFEGLDWTLVRGDRVVLLGPNGAGKTTLMKTCAGLLRPRAGRVATAQHETATPQQLAQAVALMPQHVTAVPRLTCREQVAYAGWLAGLPTAEAEQRADGALAAVGLTDHAGNRATALSGGQLRRLGLAESLVRRTEVLLLDEPTAGLDPAQRARFRRVLADLPRDTTVVVSTHETHDIAEAFTRVCILASGCFLYDGSPQALLERTGADTIEQAYARLMEDEA